MKPAIQEITEYFIETWSSRIDVNKSNLDQHQLDSAAQEQFLSTAENFEIISLGIDLQQINLLDRALLAVMIKGLNTNFRHLVDGAPMILAGRKKRAHFGLGVLKKVDHAGRRPQRAIVQRQKGRISHSSA